MQTFQRIRIAFKAIRLYWGNKFRKKPKNNRVAIIFQQIFGDSILFLPALDGYLDLFHRQRGYDVTLLCLPSIKKFWDETAHLPKDITIETVDFKRFYNDYTYFKSQTKHYRDSFEISIVAGSSLSADLMSTVLCSQKRYGMVSCIPVRWPLQVALFQRLAYDNALVPPIGSMIIQRYRMMLNHLGNTSYKGRLSQLKYQHPLIDGRYCVVCPGASMPQKCWPIERFSHVVDWLIEKYDYDIHLCGGAPERADADKLVITSKYPKRIHNRVGETSFAEWSAIVQYADLVIGNDSATLHIAAATGRKCICLAGVYDKFQFFPYLVDELRKGERLPETIYVDKPCAFCRTKGYYPGYGNRQCQKEIRDGKCALCISEITEARVESVIEKLLTL